MGGIMKGGYGHMHAAYNSSSSRRRWINVYVVMAIVSVVFGCGVLGLMGLHRLKERRILNLLIKEKNDQILSLHHLSQKEKEHIQELKMKTEKMKIKILSLRGQKTELNSRVLDMQSTVSSLRDEQKAIELAFQEKQNEAKLLKEQCMEMKDQNAQVKALTEALQQKEDEIEDLKHRLQLRGGKVVSERKDESSILPADITAKANKPGNETLIDENEDRDVHDEEHREDGRSINGRSGTNSEEGFERMENSRERSSENGKADADRGNEQVGRTETEAEKNEYETEKMGNLGNEERKKPTDEDAEAHFADRKRFSTMGDTNSRRISKSQRSDNQDLEVHKGLVTLEMKENSHGGHDRFRGKHGYLKKAKGKRWRPIAKQTEGKRSSRINVASTMGDQGLVEGTEEIGDKREEGKPRIMGLRLQNESVSGNQQFEIDDMPQDAVNHTEEDEQSKEKEITVVEHAENNEQLKEQEITITDHAETNNDGQNNDRLERKEAAERNEDADGIQMERFEESEHGENSEDKEQKDEPEF